MNDSKTVLIDSLFPDPANVRLHDHVNLTAIKASLLRFGQQKPIVVDANGVIRAGNGTWEAAKQLGWQDISVVESELDGPDMTAYAIADNRTAELATWDQDALDKQLAALDDELRDVAYINLDKMLEEENAGAEPSEKDDQVPEVEENPYGVQRGDIWQLGNHRIMCGDSTSKEDVDKLMAGEKADMVFTDPPYGISIGEVTSRKPSNEKLTDGRQLKRNTYRDSPWDHSVINPNIILDHFPDTEEIFLFGANNYANFLPPGNEHGWMVWDKRTTEDSARVAGSDFELCWSKKIHGLKIIKAVWFGPFGHHKKNDGAKRVHPTQKPVKLIDEFFRRWGKDKTLIVDLFLGSGSTLIACEKTKRKCFGMEIDPHYVSVIIKRFEEFTGEKAVKI